MKPATGQHFLIDLTGCKHIPCTGYEYYPVLDKICDLANLTIMTRLHYQFHPIGTTIIYVLGESHLTINDYIENQNVAFDIYSCKKIIKTTIIHNLLSNFLCSTTTHTRLINRLN